MRKLMMWVLFPAVVAAGAALIVSTPAQAAKPVTVGYMTPAQLQSLCGQIGGTFDDIGGGDSMCILPDGRVMVCYTSIKLCAWHYSFTPKTGWRDGAVLGDMVLQDPPSPLSPVRDAANVRSVLSR